MSKFQIEVTVLAFWISTVGCPASQPPAYSDMFGIINIPVDKSATIFTPIGSAFVCGPHKDVVTCAHVAIAAAELARCTNLTYTAQDIGMRKLKLKFCLPRFDLAVFAPDSDIPGTPAAMGDFKKVRPNDTIYYYGFDSKLSTPNLPAAIMRKANVSAIGSEVNDGTTVDFIEFEGEGIPGYSGGPVFNESGELVAIMREAWTKQPIKGGPSILINRAFSIEVLRMQDEPMYTGFQLSDTNAPATKPSNTNSANMSLLDELGIPATNGSSAR